MTTMTLLDFIAELHVHGMLEGHQIFACLRVLLKGLKTVEHIQAIYRLAVCSKGDVGDVSAGILECLKQGHE